MDDKKLKQENITIPKKALLGIAAAFPMLGILVSKGNIGPLILFIIGIALGIFIGKGFFENNK
ncbi:hypothetical protein HOD19_03075 [bacterium]|jgi:hypothetical protein|nr:hypothetical protein [bacterium]